MEKSMTLVIATSNKGKTAEIKDLLKGFPVDIKNLNDFGPIPPLEENGNTFDENAYQKASFAARILGLPALADDSGLLVEALGNAPGIHSARYAGENATDEQKYLKLLDEMITERPIGSNGFGYDPIFFYPPLNKTFAELTREFSPRRRIVPLRAGGQPVGLTGRLPARRVYSSERG